MKNYLKYYLDFMFLINKSHHGHFCITFSLQPSYSLSLPLCMCGLWIWLCARGGQSRMLCILTCCFLLTLVTRSFAEPGMRLVACSPQWSFCLWLTTAVQASTQLFKWVLRIWTQVLMLAYWALKSFPQPCLCPKEAGAFEDLIWGLGSV